MPLGFLIPDFAEQFQINCDIFILAALQVKLEDNMVKVICIGMYNGNGIFVSDSWIETLDWLKQHSDSLIVYCRFSLERLTEKFEFSCDIDTMVSPDREMDVKAYKSYNLGDAFWETIKRVDYCIDSNADISHLFFMHNDKLLCSLEITDDVNFMIIYEDDFNQLDFENIISDKNYNASQCALYKDDIDDLVEGEMWMP